jgi:phosphatidylserine/phosphatidylglycerophosphate/cardiolipin synthase-like enzyme
VHIYTVLIIVTIFLSYLIGYKFNNPNHPYLKHGKNLGHYTIIAWIIWSFLMINTSGLLIWQLSVILISGLIIFQIIKFIYKQATEISELKKNYREYESEVLNKHVNQIERKNIQRLRSPRLHRQKLIETLKQTNKTLIIISGWATDFCMDKEFRSLIKKCLERGVDIFVGYGYEKSNETQRDQTLRKNGEEIINELQEWSSSFKSQGLLRKRYYPEHSKILICDDKYAIYGSFNWLSNSGNSKNDERSVIIYDKKIINEEIDEITREFEDLKLPASRREFFRKFYPNLYPKD